MENKIRSTLNEIYFGKTRDVVSDLRFSQSATQRAAQENLQRDIFKAIEQRQAGTKGHKSEEKE